MKKMVAALRAFSIFAFAVSCFLLSQAAFARVVLAQAVADPSAGTDPDLGALITQAFAAISDFKKGAILLGLVIFVNILTNLTKIPALANKIAPSWRPVISIAVGLASSVLGARASGQTWQVSLSVGVPAGIAVGGGSIALHEAVQTLKAFVNQIFKVTVVVAFVALAITQTSCSLFKSTLPGDESACLTAAVQTAKGDLAADLAGFASSSPATWLATAAADATTLALSVGGPAAVCALESLIADFDPQGTTAALPTSLAEPGTQLIASSTPLPTLTKGQTAALRLRWLLEKVKAVQSVQAK